MGRTRRSRAAVFAAGGVLGLGALWLAGTGWMARAELHAAQGEVDLMRSHLAAADLDRATLSADAIARHADRAHWLTRGPAWAVAARLPLVGDSVAAVRGISTVADALATDALPALVEAGRHLDPQRLRTDEGRIDLAALGGAAPRFAAISDSLDRAASRLTALPTARLLPGVESARHSALAQLRTSAEAARSASATARMLPALLGSDRPRTYFLVFQNTAEARGTGGLPGAFAIVEAEDGQLRFTRFGSNAELRLATAEISLDPEFEDLYRWARAKDLFLNSNLSPHFPYAAQIWRAMWEQHSGQRVDGALALDPQTLSYLLAATGPARLPGGETVTAAQVVPLTQNTAYLRFGADYLERKNYLLQIARAAAARITAGAGDPGALARALHRGVRERRVLAWSAEPAIQRALEEAGAAGVVSDTAGPYAGLTIINEGGNKLDYYLERSLSWQRSGCGPRRQVRVTVTLTNTAPPGLPTDYLANRSDRRAYRVQPGDHRVSVLYAATAGALMNEVRLDGRPYFASIGVERGHPVYAIDVELPRGDRRTVELMLDEPDVAGPPDILRQPLVRPLRIQTRDIECDVNPHSAISGLPREMPGWARHVLPIGREMNG